MKGQHGHLHEFSLILVDKKEDQDKSCNLQPLPPMLLLLLSSCNASFYYRAGNNFAPEAPSLIQDKSFYHNLPLILERIAEKPQVPKQQKFNKHIATYKLFPQIHLFHILSASWLKCQLQNNLMFYFYSEFKRILTLYRTAQSTQQAMLISQVLLVQISCRQTDLGHDFQLMAGLPEIICQLFPCP